MPRTGNSPRLKTESQSTLPLLQAPKGRIDTCIFDTRRFTLNIKMQRCVDLAEENRTRLVVNNFNKWNTFCKLSNHCKYTLESINPDCNCVTDYDIIFKMPIWKFGCNTPSPRTHAYSLRNECTFPWMESSCFLRFVFISSKFVLREENCSRWRLANYRKCFKKGLVHLIMANNINMKTKI